MAKKAQINAVRTVREVSAGGLIWRRDEIGGEPMVVLVRPAGRSTWVIPKGGLERNESREQAAVRECREETGYEVEVGPVLGRINYFYTRRDDHSGQPVRVFKRVDFFLMKHRGGDASAHDHEIDEVRWFRIDEALQRSSYRNEREL
ncbi:MAG TPA: NUDIX domain-containing protein, partial [Candidatus Binataceae bacterium]|nr:NUDIX domain-containing protein [Candidatus Binataceae bacterium]